MQLMPAYFFLITPLLLIGAEKTEFKKAIATKSRMDRVEPSYESFVMIKKILEILEDKAICKHPEGTEYVFNPVVDSRFGQTQQGVRLSIGKCLLPLRLQTEFGTVGVETNSDISHSNIRTQLCSVDMPIVLDARSVGAYDSAFYDIKAIGIQDLPSAQVAVKYLKGKRLKNLWQTYSQRYDTEKNSTSNNESSAVSKAVKQSSVEVPDKKEDASEITESKKDEDDGWELVD